MITFESLKERGFCQVEGAPENVLDNGTLRVYPERKSCLGRADWSLPMIRMHSRSLPMELIPETNEQLDLLIALMEKIKNENGLSVSS